MFGQGFTHRTISSLVRKIDYQNFPEIKKQEELNDAISTAIKLLRDPDLFSKEIIYYEKSSKRIARLSSYMSHLAMRKVDLNVRMALPLRLDTRQQIVRALKVLLSEGVPYRMYKLDIKRFYESFDVKQVSKLIRDARGISGPTELFIERVLANHVALGGSGLPRGLAISATLSDRLMQPIDRGVRGHKDVYFYRRYVDDITIITSKREDSVDFISTLGNLLKSVSSEMDFKASKYFELDAKRFISKEAKAGNFPKFDGFDYLGYKFNVAKSDHRPAAVGMKEVWLDIADKKVKKIKTRLIRSYLDFLGNGDFALLRKRIRHLTSNISMLDRAKGIRRMVGIHYNYPLVDYAETRALKELDQFFANSLSSQKGRVYRKLQKKLSAGQVNELKRFSFYVGAKHKRFYQMGVAELGKVQECWKYE